MVDAAVGFRTSDFEYDLPPELIAQTPTAVRGDSRLLVVRRGDLPPRPATEFTASHFADLANLVCPGDLLVLNSTKVRHARLLGRRASGAPAEVLLVHPATEGTWVAMGKPGSALRLGRRVDLGDGVAIETVEELAEGYRRVRLLGATAEEAMARFGRIPLPPYIDREPTPEDAVRYQTVFAEREGSVAAPTAGLHFTPELLRLLEERGARTARLELEVGPGTFKPVDQEDYTRHSMHLEQYDIPEAVAAAVADTRARGGSVWAVGTTVVRALESAVNEDGGVRAGRGETGLMITPGYRFRAVDRLVTNLHLPRSTLLMLVAGFAGYEVTRAAYQTAVRERFRFYSYGDAMAVI